MCLAGLVSVAAACSETTPTAPSPVVTVEGPATSLMCPAGVDLLLNARQQVAVTFPLPTVGGLDATKSECVPGSGSMFSVGTTRVTCSSTVAADLVTSCRFAVRVTSRSLLVTDILAFGDSITSGTVSELLAVQTLSGVSVSYPAQLEGLLQERYPEQTFSIVNAGVDGEGSSGGRARLPGVLDVFRPDVLLLLEGINGLEFLGPENVAEDLEAMVAIAQSRGVSVLLATVLPLGDDKAAQRPGARAAIDDLNQRIRQIAQRRGAGLVDLFSAFSQTPTLIGRDGLHPTEVGYQLMAGEFLGEIISRWEKSEEGPGLSLGSQGQRLPRN